MRAVLFIALIILALGITGNGDYEAELAEVDHYCELVRSNVWPDFNHNINHNNYNHNCGTTWIQHI